MEKMYAIKYKDLDNTWVYQDFYYSKEKAFQDMEYWKKNAFYNGNMLYYNTAIVVSMPYRKGNTLASLRTIDIIR